MEYNEEIRCSRQEAHHIRLLEFDAQISKAEATAASLRNKKAVYLYETVINQVKNNQLTEGK